MKPWKNFDFFAEGRSARILRHIAYSAGLKLVNAIISFLVIPLYLSYLGHTSFGIWLTVSAVIQWFNFFDLGLGNGLRNRFAEARAAGNNSLAQVYVSTSYALISGIAVLLMLAFLAADQWVAWSVIFAAPAEIAAEVDQMVLVLALLFCPQFTVQLIKMVVTGDQRPALANGMNTAVNVLQLAAIYALYLYSSPSLVLLAAVLGGINLLVPIVASLWLYAGRYIDFRPRWSMIELKYGRDLLMLGSVFFVLQAAAVVVFMTDNLIITHLLGPEEVPAYNISFRYFNLIAVFFGLVTTPFWSAITDAWYRNDFLWISRMLRKLFAVWVGSALLCAVMLVVAPWVYSFWLGANQPVISQGLNAAMAAWIILSTGMSIFGTFLSGVGKLRLSFYHAIFVMIVNIPLSIYFAKTLGWGSAGVILASAAGLFFRVFFQPLQTLRLLRGAAKGIWNR